MDEQIAFDETFGPALRDEIRDHWRSRRHRLERLLSRIPPESRRLRICMRHGSLGYEVRAVLTVPFDRLAAEGRGDTWREAADAVLDRLIREIRDYKERRSPAGGALF